MEDEVVMDEDCFNQIVFFILPLNVLIVVGGPQSCTSPSRSSIKPKKSSIWGLPEIFWTIVLLELLYFNLPLISREF